MIKLLHPIGALAYKLKNNTNKLEHSNNIHIDFASNEIIILTKKISVKFTISDD